MQEWYGLIMAVFNTPGNLNMQLQSILSYPVVETHLQAKDVPLIPSPYTYQGITLVDWFLGVLHLRRDLPNIKHSQTQVAEASLGVIFITIMI